MKQPEIQADGRCVKITYPHAKQDYTCYGCGGECPIPKGEWYMRVSIVAGGKISSHHYCQRCAYALENKLNHCKESIATISEGSLRFNRLNSDFRKHWLDMANGFAACKTEDEKLIVEKTFTAWLRGEKTK